MRKEEVSSLPLRADHPEHGRRLGGDDAAGRAVPAGGVTLLNGGAPAAAVFSSFLSLPAPVGTLSLAGTQNLLVGVTLSVGASQAGGTYSGLLNVTVAFN